MSLLIRHKLLLSNLRGFKAALNGELLPLRLIDLSAGPLDVDYPRLTHLIFRNQPSPQWDRLEQELVRLAPAPLPAAGLQVTLSLEWTGVTGINWKQKIIEIERLSVLRILTEEELVKSLFLRRDVLDEFIIDLQNRRVTRANDLLIQEDEDGLSLRAVDTSARALLRRIFPGLYQGGNPDKLQDWKYVEFLRGDPAAVHIGAPYLRRIARLTAGEIASLVDRLPYLHAAELIMLLPVELAADTLELMSPERQVQIFEELDDEVALQAVEKMAPDLAADLLGRLAADDASQIIDQLSEQAAQRIVDLLRYPDNTVGGVMTNDVIAIPGDMTIAEARQWLQGRLEEPDFVYFLYVVDDLENRRLQGVASLRNFLLARDEQRMDEIMNPYLITLQPLAPPQEAAYRLINSQLVALPVISDDGKLLGAVTVDAAISQVAPSSWSAQAPRVFS